MTFGLLRVRLMFFGAAILVAIVVEIAVYLKVSRFRFLLMTFRRRPLGSPVTSIVDCFVLSLESLSLVCALSVQSSWFTVSTRVIEFWLFGIVHAINIKAFEMLPSIACFAVDRQPVVVGIATNTFYRVRLLRLGDWKRIVRRDQRSSIEGALSRSRDLRCDRKRLFCHNLAKASQWLFE